MKKSNKLFFIGITALFLVPLIIFVAFKYLHEDDFSKNEISQNLQAISAKSSSKISEWVLRFSSDVNIVNLDGRFDFIVEPGKFNQLSVVANKDVYKFIKFSRNKNVLTIRLQDGSAVSPLNKIKIVLTTPNMNGIMLTGNNHVDVKNIISDSLILKMRGDNIARISGSYPYLKLVTAGNSRLDVNIQKAEKIQLMSLGATKIILSGTADNFVIWNYGNSLVLAKNLMVNNLIIESNFSFDSKMIVQAKKTLSATSLGKTEVDYYGNPTINIGKRNGLLLTKRGE
ncbi:MAG: DUF2807 domain-containing protein [Gammaproteobacteria bacterium]|nr:DUF2807 domain-containing protein [Gammaproteobacteria bacterium]